MNSIAHRTSKHASSSVALASLASTPAAGGQGGGKPAGRLSPGAAAAELVRSGELKALRRIAATIVSGGLDPDDLVQDALERALRSFDQFAAGTNLFAWVRTIMQRLAIDAWRRNSRRRHVPLPDTLVAAEPAPPTALEPWEELSMADVRQAMAALSEPLRTTFRMHTVDRRSYLEISAMLGVPISTVGTRMRRARLKLRGLLEAQRSGRERQPVLELFRGGRPVPAEGRAIPRPAPLAPTRQAAA